MGVGAPPEAETLSEDNLAHTGLLHLCQSIHMDATGASEPMWSTHRAQVRAYLQKRLETWRSPSSFYDEAVRRLVTVALASGQEAHEYQDPWGPKP